jgi:short-subunit dehydrogenase
MADHNQVYISSRDAKACNETASRLTKAGPGECIAIPGDLAKFDECVKLVKELEKREKALHVLVCPPSLTITTLPPFHLFTFTYIPAYYLTSWYEHS